MPQKDVIKNLHLRIVLYEDINAYKELYMLLFDGMYKFSYSFVKSHEVAEEIVSDAFIKLWIVKNQLQHIDNLKAYLFTIVKNISFNYLTKNSKNPIVDLNDVYIESAIELKNPEVLYISKETINEIERVIHQLPSQSRIIFQLVKEEGLKYKEVASILNISVFTVRNQIAIATKKIGEALFNRTSPRSEFVIPNLLFGS